MEAIPGHPVHRDSQRIVNDDAAAATSPSSEAIPNDARLQPRCSCFEPGGSPASPVAASSDQTGAANFQKPLESPFHAGGPPRATGAGGVELCQGRSREFGGRGSGLQDRNDPHYDGNDHQQYEFYGSEETKSRRRRERKRGGGRGRGRKEAQAQPAKRQVHESPQRERTNLQRRGSDQTQRHGRHQGEFFLVRY